MISTELTNNDGTGSTNAKIMRRWTAVKTVAALVVVCGILLVEANGDRVEANGDRSI